MALVADIAVAVPIVGELGINCIVMLLDAEELRDVPFALVAVTVYVLAPEVFSVITIGLDAPVFVTPEEEVTVYVADAPPVAPGVKETDVVLYVEAVAVPIVGACGILVAVTPDEAEDAADVPYGLVADTVYVYEVDEDNPVTIIGLDEPVNVVGDVAGVGVTTKLVGAPPLVDKENATDALPLLCARPEGVSVATTEVGTPGAAAIGNHPFVV